MSSWRTIFDELTRLHTIHGPTLNLQHAFAKPIHQMSLREVVREIRTISAEYDPVISENIAHWRIWADFMPLTGPAEVWRFQRVHAARTFVSHLTSSLHPEKSAQVFPGPECSEEEAIKWLLTGWWNEEGIPWFALFYKGQAQ